MDVCRSLQSFLKRFNSFNALITVCGVAVARLPWEQVHAGSSPAILTNNDTNYNYN
jgi:hypothetical protein